MVKRKSCVIWIQTFIVYLKTDGIYKALQKMFKLDLKLQI